MSYRSLLFIPALAAALLTGCGEKEAAVQAVEAPPVRTAVLRVEARPFEATVAITGTLVSTTAVEVKAETIGKVVKFPKEEGDPVRAGEAVVWVDDSDERIRVRQAESAVQVADAVVERAKLVASHNHSELERAKNLVQSGGITDRDYKSAELADKDSQGQVAVAEAQLEQARSQLEQAHKSLADSIIYAPVGGEIQRKIVREGAYVEAPTPVFSLVDNSRLELESMVPAADLGSIVTGQQVSFLVNSFPGRKFPGRVIEVNPAVQVETRSAKVRVRVDNSSKRLKAGMFAQGAILTGVKAEAILVPGDAVYRDDRSAKSAYLFVVENGKAARRSVRVGEEHDSVLEIVGGLKPGETIVAGQSIEIADGVRVEPPTQNGARTEN